MINITFIVTLLETWGMLIICLALGMAKHEYGHYLAHKKLGHECGKPVFEFPKPHVSIPLSVLNSETVEEKTYTLRAGYVTNLKDAGLSFVGCFIITALIFMNPDSPFDKELTFLQLFFEDFFYASLVNAVLTMLPIGSNDGYRVRFLKKLQKDYDNGLISHKGYEFGRIMEGLDKNGVVEAIYHDDYIEINPNRLDAGIIKFVDGRAFAVIQ